MATASGNRLTPAVLWQATTPRARSLLIAGIVLLLTGIALQMTDVIRVGVFAIALPLVAIAVVTRARLRIACARRSEPPVAVAGTTVEVVLTLTNRSLVPTGALHLEDQMPSHLSGQARFTLAGLGAQEARAVVYRLADVRRGRYVTGPLRIRIDDAFGLCDVVRSFAGRSEFLVTPQIESLSSAGPAVAWDVGENAGSRSVGTQGADDASIREYRYGDDLRKIHWRSTARTGTPMVRQDERPWQGRVTVALDTRRTAHGITPPAADGPEDPTADLTDPRRRDSLEWAVSAAASIAARMLASGRDTGLLIDRGGSDLATRLPLASSHDIAEHLAEVGPTSRQDLDRLLPALQVAVRESALVAVLGNLDPGSTGGLEALPGTSARQGGALLAILLDVESWLRPDATGREQAEPPAAVRLRAAGWTVVVARRGDTVADVWQAALAGAGSGAVGPDHAWVAVRR